MTELIRSREAIDAAIAYVKADTTVPAASPVGMKIIRAGEGRAVAILTRLRDAGGTMDQREFEETCLSNCRTLVGAGGFIARGSITREIADNGTTQYKLTSKGEKTVNKWEARYGINWESMLERTDTLNDTTINDHQKVRLIIK